MTKKDLREINFFYMLAFLFSGVLFGLGTLLSKAFKLGEIETILLTTMFAQFAPFTAMLITKQKFGSQYSASFSMPQMTSLFLCLLIPFIAIFSQHYLLSKFGQAMVPSPFYRTLPIALLTIGTTLLGSLGEEIGWRGYLFNRLKLRLKLWQAASLTGLMWGVWHFTKIFNQGLLAYLVFSLSLIPLSMLMSYVNDKSRGSLLPSILLHTLFNLGSMLLLFGRESIVGYLICAAGLMVVLLAIRLLDPLYFGQEKSYAD